MLSVNVSRGESVEQSNTCIIESSRVESTHAYPLVYTHRMLKLERVASQKLLEAFTSQAPIVAEVTGPGGAPRTINISPETIQKFMTEAN